MKKYRKTKMQALKPLRKDKSIIVCKPDKGNGVVIIDETDYIIKKQTILGDNAKFEPLNCDNLEYLHKFQRFLTRLKKRGASTAEEYCQIRPTTAATPTLCNIQ